MVLLSQARAEQRLLHPGVVDLGLGQGDPSEGLRVDVPQSRQARLVDDLELDDAPREQGDRPLRLDDHVLRLGSGEPEGLHEPLQCLERQTDLLGELEMGLRPAGAPSLERPTLDERERQESRPDRFGHAFHRQATLLARPRDPDLQGVDRSEGPPPVTRDQDAARDEAFDLLRGNAGPSRELHR